jgi:hypothetical protein
MMQMFVATLGVGLLLTTGISIATLAVTLLATVLRLLSRRLSQESSRIARSTSQENLRA